MKAISKIAAVVAMVTTALGPTAAMAAPVCIWTDRIQNTSIPDVRTIDFHMKDGTVWRNTLRHDCPNLKWWGFVYVLHGPNEICENLQAIRVLHTGDTCLLGAFTKLPPREHIRV